MLAAVSLSFLLFLRDFGSPADEVSYADAIVILTGGFGRRKRGLICLRRGREVIS